MFGFENRRRIFDIDERYKFCPLVVQKGGTTDAIHTAFMRRELTDWETPERFALDYPKAQADRFSPKSRAVLEVRTRRDLDLVERIYDDAVLLGDQGGSGWELEYACEFHMTNDSGLFHPRGWWESRGYLPDEYGRWIKANWSPSGARARIPGLVRAADGLSEARASDIQDVALPLYEGRMIGQFDFSEKGWVSGRGRSAVWRGIPWHAKCLEPQQVMAEAEFGARSKTDGERANASRGMKCGFMAIGSSTNARSMVSSLIFDCPCGNAVPILSSRKAEPAKLALAVNLNSYAYDYVLRTRLGGINLNYFVIEETPLLRPDSLAGVHFAVSVSAALSMASSRYATEWRRLASISGGRNAVPWRRLWAITPHERLRLRCVLDAIVAELYGLDYDDFAWILRNDPSEAKGFWRVDKDKPLELRHTTLSLAAFRDLKEMGLEAFCSLNGDPDDPWAEGDGWQIPETITFAMREGDGAQGIIEIGAPDGETYPVRSRLGPRFLDWQLNQSVEESWAECELHARNILGGDGFRKLQEELDGKGRDSLEAAPGDNPKFRSKKLFGPDQGELF